jgi:dUTP pyrophosphatase
MVPHLHGDVPARSRIAHRQRSDRCARAHGTGVQIPATAGSRAASIDPLCSPRVRATPPLNVPVVRLDPDLDLPSYARDGDAGLDLRARTPVVLAPNGGRALVPTGLAVAIPEGFAGFVQPRSGLARDFGVTCLNTPGLIDAGYRGEIQVLLVNTDPVDAAVIERGQRIAQLVVQAVVRCELIEVDELPSSERGAGGFGHTGR